MSQANDWWALQFTENMKAIARLYDQFCITRKTTYLDESERLCEKLNEAYDMTFDLKDYVEFGRAMLATHAPPQFRDKDL